MEMPAPPQVLWDRHHYSPDVGTLENAEGERRAYLKALPLLCTRLDPFPHTHISVGIWLPGICHNTSFLSPQRSL